MATAELYQGDWRIEQEQSVARGLELFGEIGCTGHSMRYHPVQQRHQRMRKEWAVADSIGIDEEFEGEKTAG